ncbi:helix-turn-helix domain-containing protein [Streptomyces sp. NPDC006544]|uniref:helix-turn-helix domain-containing protein n=1 Tax=Streptomyces sp. NPDC006544 TaxID=3154583 RepID=UPI0033AB34E3
MRIHLSPRKRAFTVLGNEVLRDRRLSFTARGILGYLLSLPDGSREDVRTLADKHPGVGRRGVAKAVDELVRYGYYGRRTVRDTRTGHVRTETFVSDAPGTESWQRPDGAPPPRTAPEDDPKLTPASEPAPDPAPDEAPDEAPDPGTGEGADGVTGASPLGRSTGEEEPSLPEPVRLATASGRGASLLARIAAFEPRLTLGVTETLALAPLAEQWLAHGVSELEARSLLADGLPSFVHSARALLANRLVRKLPPPRLRRDPAAPAAPPAECGVCRDPLPSPDAPCGSCSAARTEPRTEPRTALRPAAAARTEASRAPLSPAEVASRADVARRALRGVPALATP